MEGDEARSFIVERVGDFIEYLAEEVKWSEDFVTEVIIDYLLKEQEDEREYAMEFLKTAKNWDCQYDNYGNQFTKFCKLIKRAQTIGGLKDGE